MILLLACAAPPQVVPPSGPTLGETLQISPSDLISGVVDQPSHNNLDVVEHDGRVFLAFRTAPTHFASPDTQLYVLSRPIGDDAAPWDTEASFARGTDLREPRFLSWDGRLFLYFAVLGQTATDFEPQGMMVSERGPSGWSEAVSSFETGFIPWRARLAPSGDHAGEPWLIGYTGGENLYDIDGEPVRLYLVTTSDGTSWSPVGPTAIVDEGGGSETDWVMLGDGDLLAVQRNEAGDELGFGSKICRVPAESLSSWDCVSDPRKYDSPLMFQEGGRNWLIGRRNLTDTGYYDLGMDELPAEEQAIQYELAYWNERKRCALWEVDAESRTVSWVLDLPSRGDTCFPSALPQGGGLWHVYNYSSPIDGVDPTWIEGQTGETRIYRTEIFF